MNSIKDNMRKLFTDHAVYTKFYIESALSNLPDLTVITNRLLQNQVDIGNYVKTYVGKAGGDKLTELLKQHILAAAGAVESLKTNDKTKINDAVKKVFSNSKQVAQLLGSIKPNVLSYATALKEFNKHNQYVLNIATAHYQGLYEKEYKLFDMYLAHMMHFSDTLTSVLSTEEFVGKFNNFYTAWGKVI